MATTTGTPSTCPAHEANRLSWNAATTQHRSHKPDLIDKYTHGQRNNLFGEEMRLLVGGEGAGSQEGESLAGKDVLHLQCNDGQDTISIARWLHPRSIIGVDISDTAVDFGKEMASAMQKHHHQEGEGEEQEEAEASAFPEEVNFIRHDAVDFCHIPENKGKFDVVFASYGAICWLSDLHRWAAGIAKVLRPGSGRLVVIDFHPAATAIDPISLRITDSSIGGQQLELDDGVGDYIANDYTNANFTNPHRSFEYTWSVGEIVTAILATKAMTLTSLTEYPYVNGYQMWEGMTQVAVPPIELDGVGAPQRARYAPPKGMPSLPMMYSVTAVSSS